jgi:hypothetical protein
MPLELKKTKSSNRKLENTKRQPPSSLKPEDSSLITSKVLKVKNSSKEEENQSTPRPRFQSKLLPSSKSTSNNTQRESPNSPTEKPTANSSRPSPPSPVKPHKWPMKEP